MHGILLTLIAIFISCNLIEDQGKKVTLYSDTTGVNIETTIPNDWEDYHVLKFKTDDHLSFSAFGNKDTSQQLVVDVSKSVEAQSLRGLIEAKLADRKSADTGIHLIDLKVTDSTRKYPIAFFDYYTRGEGNTYYSEDLVFTTKGRIVNITISAKGDEKTFKFLTNLIRENLR